MQQRAVAEHRHRGRAAAHVDADGAQVHLVVFQRRQGRGEGRGHHAVELQVHQLQAVAERLERALADGHHQQVQAQAAAEHVARVAHAAGAVHRPGHGQQVDRPPALEAALADRQLQGARQVVVADRPARELDGGRGAMARQLPARGGDHHAADADPRHVLGPLHRLGDGVGGFFHVDDGPAADAAGAHVGHAADVDRAVFAPGSVGLHDEAADLGRAEVHRRHQGLAMVARQHLQAVAGVAAVMEGRHLLGS